MRSARALCSMLAVFSVFASGCSSDGSSSANGGTGGTGASSQGGGGSGQPSGGATASAGGAGQGGSGSGGAAGQASGGKPEAGGAAAGGASKMGGRTSSATTQPGGAAAGGRAGSGGAGTTGPSTAAGGPSAGSGGTGTAATAKGGNTGGTGGTGGTTSGGTTSTEPVKSEGCGKTPTLQGGTQPITIQSTRKYYLRIPDAYDNSHAYRLVFTFAESGSSAKSVVDRSYFRLAGFDPKNTVFVAPDAANGAGSWSKSDVDLTDAILAQVEGDLCIDKTRIFASGFSFGGAMSIAIACTRADVFRGVAFWSGADLTGSCPSTLTKPIAYWASQASGDSSGTPSPTSGRTIQAHAAAVNGCTADANAINFPAAGQPHTCTIYKVCSAGHPTIYCVFNGGHGWEPVDPGQSTSWAPKEAWAFITQF